MVAFVEGGTEMFNSLMYAPPSNADIAYFQNNQQSLLQTAGGYAKNFINSMVDRFQLIDYEKLQMYTDAVTRRISDIWNIDTIRSLHDLVDIQYPPNQMIRWIMTNPNVRELYHKGKVAGYDDAYVDMAPGISGHDHHDYQMVMHGMEVWNEEDEDYEFVQYHTEFVEEENSLDRLTMSERVNILETWSRTDHYIEQGKEDPTSQYNGML